MADVDLAVVDQLDTAVAALTKGTNLFTGKMRAADPGNFIPEECVFCLASGGAGPEAYADGTSIEQRFSTVQCIVRSNPREHSAGQTLARAVLAGIHHAEIAGYIDVRAVTTEPLYVGEDEDGLHEWTINVELLFEE